MRSRGTKGRRVERVASLIREIVSTEIVTGLSDPRVAFVTVTGVDVTNDMRFADVRLSILAEPKEQEECFRAIRHAHGRLQEKVADAMVMKFCPVLRFHQDPAVKRSVEISAVIAKARAEDEAARADRIRRGVEPVPAETDGAAETEFQEEAGEDAGGPEADDTE